MKGIAIGESDFRNLRKRDNYYIDKSLFIKHVMDNESRVVLITRPRRFGKTLNMSMLRYYFDCTLENTKELYTGLKIMEQGEKYTSKQGYYPCIYMTFKDVRGRTSEEMITRMKKAIYDVYNQHRYLTEDKNIYSDEKEKINNIYYYKENKDAIINSIQELSEYLNRIYNKPVIIFLDEYDVPLQNAYVEGFYDEAVKFFKEFYGLTFKDNPYMEKTVLTGVSRIAKESIFSGVNNFDVYTVLDNEFSTDFGITIDELKKAIKDFNIEDEEVQIKKWYDGYVIGNTKEIYNPWSILNYLRKKELMPYWVNTSSNDLIKLILKNSKTVKEKMEILLRGEEIEAKINQETVIVGIENNEDNIWGLLVGTGYLKITETINKTKNIYKIKIPNKEIKYLFENIIDDWFRDKVIGNDLNSILKDLVTLNFEEFEIKFEILVRQMFSYMDVGENTAENFYHAFVLGMLVGLKDTYYVNSNRESGFGRYDIMLEPKDKNGNSFIMEFKVFRAGREKDINETLENAKKQIEEKKYEEDLKMRGFKNITKMVYAFAGKEVKMEVY